MTTQKWWGILVSCFYFTFVTHFMSNTSQIYERNIRHSKDYNIFTVIRLCAGNQQKTALTGYSIYLDGYA